VPAIKSAPAAGEGHTADADLTRFAGFAGPLLFCLEAELVIFDQSKLPCF